MMMKFQLQWRGMVHMLKKSKVTFSNLPTQILFENKQKKAQKIDTTSNLVSDIFDPIDSTIDESVSNSNIAFNKNPLDAYRCSATETALVNASCENEFISIAPGENVRPESITTNTFCEELSHPHSFPPGKFVSDKEKSGWSHSHSTYPQNSPKLDPTPTLHAIVCIWLYPPLCVRNFYSPFLINFYSDSSFRHSQFLSYFHFYFSLRLNLTKPISKRFLWFLFIA